MKVSKVKISNTTCLRDIELDFMIDEIPAQWIIILGENGVGKSTILKMLAINLMGDKMVYEVTERSRLANFLGDDKSFIEIDESRKAYNIFPECSTEILAGSKDGKKVRGKRLYSSTNVIVIQRITNGLKFGDSIHLPEPRTSERLTETLFSENVDIGWFCAAYGPWRRSSFLSKNSSSEHNNKSGYSKSSRFASLFNEDMNLSAYTNWITDLEYITLKDPKNTAARRLFDLSTAIFKDLLPGFSFHAINERKEIILTDGNIQITVDQLSDGYKSVTAWTGELVRSLIQAFPNSKNPLHEEGVVIVDEIDIHLHPKWQREIVNRTRTMFPNIQFIVTTHSPFVAQDITEKDKLFIIRGDDRNIEVVEWKVPIGGWRVDQILTSDLFGLKTTRSEEIELAEAERFKLLSKLNMTGLEKDDRQRLQEIENWLDSVKSAPSAEGFGEFYDAADKFLTLLERREGVRKDDPEV